MNNLSSILKELRLRKGFTQSALSKESGVSQGALSKIENGLFAPTVETLHLLCQALGVKASDLVALVYESKDDDGRSC